MASTTLTTTRRGLLGALAFVPAIVAVPSLAAPAPPSDPEIVEEMTSAQSFAQGHEIALLRVARAWIDRWKAAGGDFGLMYNADGSVHAVMHGFIDASFWTPTDRDHVQLRPHEMLLLPEHQPGAIKTLEALLTLVPGLNAAVHEAAGYPLLMDSLQQGAA